MDCLNQTDTSETKNLQQDSAHCSDTATVSHGDISSAKEGCVEAEPAKVDLDEQLKSEDMDQPAERKLNEILLSEDGWLAEMYLAAQNRILPPNMVPEHKDVNKVVSPSDKAKMYLAAQNRISSPNMAPEHP